MNKDFKLSIELGTRAKDELVDIVDHIWAQSCLEGPYIDMSGLQPKRVPKIYAQNPGSYGPNICRVQSHWGYATLPNGYQVPCICEIRYCGPEMGHCLEISFRWEALNAAYTDLNSFSEGRPNPPWYAETESWFRYIGEEICESFGFDLGTIGAEPDRFSASELLRDGIPEDRWQALLIEEGQWAHWYPSTQPRPSEAIGTGAA